MSMSGVFERSGPYSGRGFVDHKCDVEHVRVEWVHQGLSLVTHGWIYKRHRYNKCIVRFLCISDSESEIKIVMSCCMLHAHSCSCCIVASHMSSSGNVLYRNNTSSPTLTNLNFTVQLLVPRKISCTCTFPWARRTHDEWWMMYDIL